MRGRFSRRSLARSFDASLQLGDQRKWPRRQLNWDQLAAGRQVSGSFAGSGRTGCSCLRPAASNCDGTCNNCYYCSLWELRASQPFARLVCASQRIRILVLSPRVLLLCGVSFMLRARNCAAAATCSKRGQVKLTRRRFGESEQRNTHISTTYLRRLRNSAPQPPPTTCKFAFF